MMRRRFVRHPRGYAGDRPVGLRNYDQLSFLVSVLFQTAVGKIENVGIPITIAK